MKAILTTLALTSAVFAGAASAAVSVEQSQLGAGIQFDTASHYSSVEKVTIDAANLGSNAGNASLYIGSK